MGVVLLCMCITLFHSHAFVLLKINAVANPGYQNIFFVMWVQLVYLPYLWGLVYKPPHAPFMAKSNFIPGFVDYLHNYSTKVMMSDFNVDQLFDSTDASFFRGFLSDNSLTSIAFGVTYHIFTSDSAIDLWFVDSNGTGFKSADTISIVNHLTVCDWSTFKMDSFFETRLYTYLLKWCYS